jgi:ParB family transcriptional regulator, chromosome partitioning protein
MTKRKLVLANNPLLSGPKLEDRERTGIPYRELQLSLIDRDPNQPRVNFDEERLSELCESIKTYGVLSPILVRPGSTPGRYHLIAGERRMRAAQRAGLTSIPALIDQDNDTSGERTLAMQLVENLQRADLSPLERAHAIGALKETYNLSVRDVADRLGISKSMVQRSLEILDLPDDLLNALREGAAESKILLLAKIEDEEIRASYLKDLDVLTRRQLEKDIEKSDNGEGSSKKALSPEDQRITDEIQRSLGLKVKMVKSSPEQEGGRLVIEFYSNSDLQELFRKLVQEAH